MTHDSSSEEINAYTLGKIGTITTTMKSVNNVSAKTTNNGDRHIDKIYGSISMAVMTSS